MSADRRPLVGLGGPSGRDGAGFRRDEDEDEDEDWGGSGRGSVRLAKHQSSPPQFLPQFVCGPDSESAAVAQS